jgi:hypothetical protein
MINTAMPFEEPLKAGQEITCQVDAEMLGGGQ